MADKPVPPAEEPRPVVPVSRPSSTGDTVTVACKLEQGLVLRVFEWEKFPELMRDGTVRDGQRARPIPELQFTLRGTWVASGGQVHNPNNTMVQELMPGGYALTHGVPRQTWERWLEQNRAEPYVTNRIVFAYPTGDPGLAKEAQANAHVKSGMEPVDPKNPAARIPGGMDRRLRIGILETGEGTMQR
jgi:hypothetical protein